MYKSVLKWAILVLLVGYATGALIWAHAEARRNVCKGIEVVMEQKANADSTTTKGVMAEIRNYPGKIVGVPFHQIDIKGVENFLNRFSNFESVDCSLTTDGKLKVSIKPMVPELRIFDGDKSYYINKDGKRIDSKANFFVDVPVVAGKFNDKFRPEQVLPVSRFVSNDKVLSQLVGMIYAEDARNICLIPRIQGHVINFGDTTRLREKRDALLTMYHKVMPYKGWDIYDTISVKFEGQIVASRRDKSRPDYGNVTDEEIDLEEATLPETIEPEAD